jgi:hypothetical protein
MSSTPWILVTIAVLVVLLAIVAIYYNKNSKGAHKPDYYTFFVMGIIWFPFGVIFDMPVFYILGLVFMLSGIVNKDKWKENHKAALINKKPLKVMLLIGLALFFLLGLIFLYFKKSGII